MALDDQDLLPGLDLPEEDGEFDMAPWIGLIDIDLFDLNIAVFTSEDERIEGLRMMGVEGDKVRGAYRGVFTADEDPSGRPAFAITMTPEGIEDPLIWLHESVHAADYIMDHVGIIGGIEHTELRARLVSHVYRELSAILTPILMAMEESQGECDIPGCSCRTIH